MPSLEAGEYKGAAGLGSDCLPMAPPRRDLTRSGAQRHLPTPPRPPADEGYWNVTDERRSPPHSPSPYYRPPPPPDRSLPVQEIEDEHHVEDTPRSPEDKYYPRSFDPAEFKGDTSVLVMGSEMPPLYDSSFLQSYYQSPRPDAPVPPTPHSQTAAPSPSPLGSPYPYPFNHVRRTAQARPTPTSIQEQVARQWEVYARNHQFGNLSDFSPSSTPFEGAGADFTPWAYLHTSRTIGRTHPHDTTSMRSSPSHEPLEPPVLPPALGVKKSHPVVMRRHQPSSGRKPPPRVDSTQPRDTSPELSTSGEETAGDERFEDGDGNWSGGTIAPVPPVAVGGVDDDEKDEWVDEEDDEGDLLELEYHQCFVNNVEKRRRRWEVGWDAVMQAIQNLDRQTDATIVIMASPSHSTKLHCATSRSVRRQSSTSPSAAAMNELRGAFSRLATHRRQSRSHSHSHSHKASSLIDRLLFSRTGLNTALNTGTGPSTTSDAPESQETHLKRALEIALGSLASLGGIYEQREARWQEEMRRVALDRERVEVLLRQVLGPGSGFGAGPGDRRRVTTTTAPASVVAPVAVAMTGSSSGAALSVGSPTVSS